MAPPYNADPDDADPGDLLTRHADQIGRLVRRLVAADDAADVEQDLHVAALERPPRHRVALPAWIATTVRNLVAKRWRGRARREKREQAAAVPEPLPSTDELVARIELEEFLLRCVRELAEPERVVVLLRYFEGRSAAEIAQQLKVGESTVRARLARALARLRERLDAKSGGDRAQWVAALTPCLWKTATVAATATAGTVVGAIVMSSKTVAAAVVVVAAAATVYFTSSSRRAPSGSKVALGSHGEKGVVAPPPRLTPAPLAEPARVAEAAPVAADTSGPTTRSRAVGDVTFFVVDAVTATPLDGVTVRAMSEGLFMEMKQCSGRIRFGVTADTYTIALAAPGYEPQVHEAIVVAPDAVNDLGTIKFESGTGTLVGCVRSPELPADVRRYVELRGDGRSPCPRCATEKALPDRRAVDALAVAESRLRDPSVRPTSEDFHSLRRMQLEATVVRSPCCGYGSDRSLVEVGADGRFEFTGLAAGVYFVRALDALPRIQPTLRLEISRGERRFVDLALAPDVNLEVDLRDETGHPFVGRWKNDWSEETAPIHFVVDVDGVLVPMDAAVAAEDVRAQFGSPARLGQPPDPTEVTVATDGLPEPFAPVVVELPRVIVGRSRDRARAPFDTLFPVPPTPSFAGAEYGLRNEHPGIFVLTHLPASRVKVSANCCGLVSTEVEVDLADPAQRRVKLVINSK